MIESKTDYSRVLYEAFGGVVPGTREVRKPIYDELRNSLRQKAKNSTGWFDLAAELRALEKAILEIEVSAKLGEVLPRYKPENRPAPPPASPVLSSAVSPAPVSSISRPPQIAAPGLSANEAVALTPVEPAPSRTERTVPPPSAPFVPEPPLTHPLHPNFNLSFLNRADRISYARRVDPPAPPPKAKPQPQPKQVQVPPPPRQPQPRQAPPAPMPPDAFAAELYEVPPQSRQAPPPIPPEAFALEQDYAPPPPRRAPSPPLPPAPPRAQPRQPSPQPAEPMIYPAPSDPVADFGFDMPPQPMPQPAARRPRPPEPEAIPDDLSAGLPPPEALSRADEIFALDGQPQAARPRKNFTPPKPPAPKKPRRGLQALLAFFAIALIGSATLYVLKPEMLKPSNLLAATKQQLRSWMAKPSASRPAEQKTDPAPSTGAKVSIGEQRVPGPQEYVDVAIQHINRRDFTRAFTALEQAEAMGARGSDFFAARAYANWASGNQEQAIADYGEAIRIDPGNATNYTNRAVAYNSRGEHMLAIRDLERAIAIEPNNPDNWNSRCWSRGLVGQLQEAILDCNESLRLRPNDPNTLDSRGFAHLRAGENTRAIADFDAALAANNQIPSSLYGRGLAKMRTGDRSGGLKDIAEAKSMNPGIEELFTKIGIR